MMNTIFRLFLLIVFGLTFGCKSVTDSVFNNRPIHRVEIATVGSADASILDNTFNSVGFITLNRPIKLGVTPKSFTKRTYNDFLKAKASQSPDLNIRYVDTLEEHPIYLKIRISDVIGLMEQLKEPSNKAIKSYLETDQRSGVVMELSMAFPKATIDTILAAEAVFLTQSAGTIYQFQLLQKNGELTHIPLKDGVVMDYGLATPCWKKARQNTYEIVQLVGSGDKCASGTYRSPRFIKEEDDYFKF